MNAEFIELAMKTANEEGVPVSAVLARTVMYKAIKDDRQARKAAVLKTVEALSLGGVPAFYRKLGGRIKSRRLELGISQTEIAYLLGGITFQQVQKYETGQNRIPVDRLLQLSRVFQTPVERLLEGLGR